MLSDVISTPMVVFIALYMKLPIGQRLAQKAATSISSNSQVIGHPKTLQQNCPCPLASPTKNPIAEHTG
jgi:hypothetical protein